MIRICVSLSKQYLAILFFRFLSTHQQFTVHIESYVDNYYTTQFENILIFRALNITLQSTKYVHSTRGTRDDQKVLQRDKLVYKQNLNIELFHKLWVYYAENIIHISEPSHLPQQKTDQLPPKSMDISIDPTRCKKFFYLSLIRPIETTTVSLAIGRETESLDNRKCHQLPPPLRQDLATPLLTDLHIIFLCAYGFVILVLNSIHFTSSAPYNTGSWDCQFYSHIKSKT